MEFKMKKFAFAIMTILCVAIMVSCGDSSNLDKINGKWSVDVEQTFKLMGQAPQEQNKLAQEMMGNMLKTMKIEFNSKNKTVIVAMVGASQTKNFSVVSDSGKTLVLSQDSQTVEIEVKNNDSIIFKQGTQQVMVLKRDK
jgi:hypothetical protein